MVQALYVQPRGHMVSCDLLEPAQDFRFFKCQAKKQSWWEEGFLSFSTDNGKEDAQNRRQGK